MSTPVSLATNGATPRGDEAGPLVRLIDAAGAPLLLRDLFAGGDPGPIAAALAQVPELCQAALPFLGAALGPSLVAIRLKEIAILRTSALLGCRYCVDAHTVVAADVGFGPDELAVLRCELDPIGRIADPVEAAVLGWVDAVAGGRGALTSPSDRAAEAAVRLLLADHAIVELTITIGTTMLLNRFATALRLPTSGDTLRRLVGLGLADWSGEARP